MSADDSSAGGGFTHAMIDFFAGVVLIFMLFLVVSSVRLQISESNRETRNALLEELREAVVQRGGGTSPVSLVQAGALELDPVKFEFGKSTFSEGSEDNVRFIARKLASSLRCYVDETAPTKTSLAGEACVPQDKAPQCSDSARSSRVETVLIEGHTDSVDDDEFNTSLSAARAMRVMAAMIDHCPELAHYKTRYDPADASTAQPVFGIAGYGERRLKYNNEGAEDRAASRRVELRIIMRPPAARTPEGLRGELFRASR